MVSSERERVPLYALRMIVTAEDLPRRDDPLSQIEAKASKYIPLALAHSRALALGNSRISPFCIPIIPALRSF